MKNEDITFIKETLIRSIFAWNRGYSVNSAKDSYHDLNKIILFATDKDETITSLFLEFRKAWESQDNSNEALLYKLNDFVSTLIMFEKLCSRSIDSDGPDL